MKEFQGRKRPPYKPKDIHCPHCGSGLTQKAEESQLVVCSYCGSRIDVSAAELKVLGKGGGRKISFPLNVGDSYYHKNARYEILARLAFIEDGDYSEMSKEYLLYNPYRGTMWLSEYQGSWSVSTDSHVMPVGSVMNKKRGSTIKTHDNRTWVCEGSGVYELVFVDGALPWIAKVGDRIEYVEFAEKNGSGMQYEVQMLDREIEFGMGNRLSLAQVREATRKSIPKAAGAAKSEDAAATRKSYLTLIWAAVLAVVINLLIFGYSMTKGEGGLF